MKRTLSATKRERLESLATRNGIIAALAMDQRKSLRRMIAEAKSVPLESIPDEQLSEFKVAVTSILTPETSAVLLDTEYGSQAFLARAGNCGLLATYEADGYENPRPHRMLALMPRLSVRRLRDVGAAGIKILLSYAPDSDEAANDEKKALIERIGAECEALEMPFFLEPVIYDPSGIDPKSVQFARIKPELVIRTMEEFSKPIYKVDVLKVEFPATARYTEGCSVYSGQKAFTRGEALHWFRAADAAARVPYIYLSAGITISEFVDSLSLAAEAQAKYSGVLCGRANWQDGIPVYASGGKAALHKWLATEGLANVARINECLRDATPWWQRIGQTAN